MQGYVHFTIQEREILQEMLRGGASMRKIATRLARSVSSVSREVKRGSGEEGYYALGATLFYLQRRKRCQRGTRIGGDAYLKAFVERGLDRYWSPEIIAAKWKEAHPGAKLSHSTIYKALKNKQLPGYSPEKYLIHRNGVKYNNKNNNNNTLIPSCNFISARPVVAEKRNRIGDWEGDLINGSSGGGHLVTCVDRKTRFLTTTIANDKRPESIRAAMCETLAGKPVFTLTLDRGGEFAEFHEMEEALGCDIYFADPYSPWQRGSNENLNGLLRFFFPRGTDFKKVSAADLDAVVELINNRPRKCLGWLSPKEVFYSKCCT